MALSRLHSRDSALAASIAAAPDVARALALFAAESAIASCGVKEPEVMEALRLLALGERSAAMRLRPGLQRLVEELERPYFMELASTVDSPASLTPAAHAAFGRARAVSALSCALADDPVDAALEATYEAQASVPEPDSSNLLESIRKRLHGGPGRESHSE
jgi:hypothetical protein